MAQDILILGGGPSGLSTALHLARLAPHLAPRILILEKMHYPRPKLCAGGLVADAEVILQRLGLDVSEVPHVDASSAHFDFAGAGLKISTPNKHTIRVVRRDEFDHWLAKKAESRGIEIRQGVTVKNVQPREQDVIVATDAGIFTAQVVIGADGSNGITRRCTLPNVSVHTARVLEVLTPAYPHHPAGTSPKSREAPPQAVSPRRARGPNGEAGFGGGREGAAYFDFFPVPNGIAGYVWDFPTQLKGQPMRCWGIYDTNVLADQPRPQLKAPLADEMARHGFKLDEYELKGYPIRWFNPFHRLSVPRVILVGDAAGVDGIFGEGISMALGYGWVAARAVREAFGKNDFSFRDYHRRVLFSPLGQTLAIRTLITYFLYNLHWEWIQKLFWRAFKPVVLVASWVFVLNWAKRLR